VGTYIQILNLNATTPVGGVAILSLDFFNVNSAPGAGNLAGMTAAKTAITTPLVDADGNSVSVGKFIDFNDLSSLTDAPEGQSFVNYTIAVSAATLSAIGLSTGFSILLPGAVAATPILAGTDVLATFNAAFNALLTGTVDTAGGRAAIQFLAVDALTNDKTNAATGTQLLSPGSASVQTSSNQNPHLSDTPESAGGGGDMGGDSLSGTIGSSNLNVNTSQLNGLIRLNMALSGDPAIGDIEMVALKPSTFEGTSAKVLGSIDVESYDPSTDTFIGDVANGTPITFNSNLGSVVPNGLTAGTVYYAVNSVDGTFNLSSSPGGGVIDILGKAVSASILVNSSVFTFANHGYSVGDQVKFNGIVATGGLTPGLTYYVVNSNDTGFSLSLTAGGSPITAAATGTAIALTNLTSPDTTTASGTVHALSPTDATALTYRSTGATVPGTISFSIPEDAELSVGQSIVFGSAIGTSILANTEYYVRTIGSSTFTVSASMIFDAETEEFLFGLPVTALASSGTIAAGIDSGVSDLQFGPAGFLAIDALLGYDSPLTHIGGVTLDFPSKIAVSNSASSAPQYNSFPIDIASLNAIGALGGLSITINMAPAIATPGNKLVSQFLSMSVAQADAVASNGVSIILVGLDLKDPDDLSATQAITDASFAATNVIRIRDTAANINVMTEEQAKKYLCHDQQLGGGRRDRKFRSTDYRYYADGYWNSDHIEFQCCSDTSQ